MGVGNFPFQSIIDLKKYPFGMYYKKLIQKRPLTIFYGLKTPLTYNG